MTKILMVNIRTQNEIISAVLEQAKLFDGGGKIERMLLVAAFWHVAIH